LEVITDQPANQLKGKVKKERLKGTNKFVRGEHLARSSLEMEQNRKSIKRVKLFPCAGEKPRSGCRAALWLLVQLDFASRLFILGDVRRPSDERSIGNPVFSINFSFFHFQRLIRDARQGWDQTPV
jgi:hypothetical protein